LAEDEIVQQRIVVLDQQIEQGLSKRLATEIHGVHGARLGAGIDNLRHDQHSQIELLGQRPSNVRVVSAEAVHLVDEKQEGHALTAKRSDQHPGLSLNAFNSGNNDDGRIKYRQRAFDLGNDVGVTGGIDEIDRCLAHRKRDHGSLDRYPALPLKIQTVSLSIARVDAAEFGNRPRVKEQAFSKAGFSCVYVGQDAQIQCAHYLSSSQNSTFGFDEKELGALGPLSANCGYNRSASLARRRDGIANKGDWSTLRPSRHAEPALAPYGGAKLLLERYGKRQLSGHSRMNANG
jgi:hypothetical protein